MLIANPIYDSVFRYLLNDEKIAKIILSTMLDREIIELDFKPTELPFPDDNLPVKYSVFRLDFSAKIKAEDGTLTAVIIELQKAKLPNDILRFRRYLASAYQSIENTYKSKTRKNKPKTIGIPIYAIYILGHFLERVNFPVIRVDRNYIDVATGKMISEKNEFIEGITHNALIIQLPALKKNRRNSLEKLLTLFDPSFITDDRHLLDINEEDVPEKYKEVFRRLLQAAQTPAIQKMMNEEDEYLDSLIDLEHALAEKDNALAEEKRKIAEKDSTITEKNNVIAEKNKALDEEKQKTAEKEKALASKQKMIDELLKKLEDTAKNTD
ncbi:MAG: hypothetical protein HQM10_00065 [Candidatus Riflebacteria bacterium]|nr:hypothetical protein [Candidatus Riflebacteria bacterium]